MKMLRILTISIFLLCAMNTGITAAEQGKIGYVDLSRLFDEYHKTKDYDKQLELKHGELEKVGKEKIEKIKESENKLALLKEDQKDILKEEINILRNDAEDFVRQEQSSLTKERNEKIREILLEIEKIVSEFAEKENYDIILNDRVLIYGNEAKNLTEDILTILNAE